MTNHLSSFFSICFCLILIAACSDSKKDTTNKPRDVVKESQIEQTPKNLQLRTPADITVDSNEPEIANTSIKEEVESVKTVKVNNTQESNPNNEINAMAEVTTQNITKKVLAKNSSSGVKIEAQLPTPTTKKVDKPIIDAKEQVAKKINKPETDVIKSVEKEIKRTVDTKMPGLHEPWEKLLSKYVDSAGGVDYAGFKNSIGELEQYLKNLETQKAPSTKNSAMAYWINAYNAFTIYLITKNYPISSITDLDSGKPWDKKWIKLNGQNLSLNDIEHNILRKKYPDARIHFAVNCAAKSCPPIWNHAWTAGNLQSNLERSTKKFINSSYNKITPNTVQLSKIFEWYAEDFPNIINFINQYSNVKVNEDAEVEYLKYDWALNAE